MIISCPSCKVRFKIPENAITEKGRKVKCTKCTHQWIQRKDGSTEELSASKKQVKNEEAQDIKKEASEDKPDKKDSVSPDEKKQDKDTSKEASESKDNTKKEKHYKQVLDSQKKNYLMESNSGLIAATVIMILLVVTSYIVTHYKQYLNAIPSVIGLFGVKESEGIHIYDLKAEITGKKGAEDLVLFGTIVNESKITKEVPDIRVTIYDVDGSVVKSPTLDSKGMELKAGEEIPFKNTINYVPITTSKVIIDIGYGLELFLR